MDWSIQQVAKLAGTTSRTLRHYDDVGLLPPSRIGANGYRYYDDAVLVRLQRILLLRDLGLGLPAIADVLARQTSEVDALAGHLAWLRQEQDRLVRQAASVSATIVALTEGGRPMAQEMFDGFDHTRFEDEVTERWGPDAYAQGARWFEGMDPTDRAAWQQRTAELNGEWAQAAAAGVDAAGPEALSLAERHVAWLAAMPGTPAAAPGGDVKAYVTGLGEMYTTDARFAANYGGLSGVRFVRDALIAYAERRL